MQAALLPDRGVVKVVGDDARRFLNGLVTNDMTKVSPGHPSTSSSPKRRPRTAAAFFLMHRRR